MEQNKFFGGKGFGQKEETPGKTTKFPGGKKKKALKGGVIVAAVGVLAALIGQNCWYSIEEEQQAVVCTFGKPAAVTEPGLHFKVPLVQDVQKVNTTIQGFAIGYDDNGYEQTAVSAVSNDDESLMITSDYNFINIDFYVEYRYSDPVKALYASENPVIILKNVAQNCIRTVIGSYPVDSVLTTGKNEIQANIKEMILNKLEDIDIGVQLINITIQDAEPPTEEVLTAFKEVETAKQGKDTAVNNANKYRNEQIPAAEAKADQIRQDALAQKEERMNEAIGQVARFNAMYEEYKKYPLITKQRMFYETMEEVLPDLKVVIDGSDGNSIQQLLPLDSFGLTGEETSKSSDTTDSQEVSSNEK